MATGEISLEDAGKILNDLYERQHELSTADMQQLEEWDRLLSYAEEQLGKTEFQDTTAHTRFFGGFAEDIAPGEKAEDALYAIKRAIWAAVFNRRSKTMEDLALKAKIWRRSISEEFSISPEGIVDEFLSWSVYLDIIDLEKAMHKSLDKRNTKLPA